MDTVNITAKDGASIPALTVGFNDSGIKAVIIVCHGFGEHAGCYCELAENLHDAGFACIIPNQRGHGLPPEGARNWHGRIPSYQCFIDDVLALTEYIREALPNAPIALYGHSMGGNIVINTLLRMGREQASRYICAVLESPWLGLYDPPNVFTVTLLRILSKVTPNLRILQKIRHGDLSSVDERVKSYGEDPLYHGFLSARMITGILDACDFAMANAASVPVPCYLAIASGDVIVCNDTINSFVEKAGSIVTAKTYKSKHAIHNDENREPFISDVITYINSKLPGR